MAPVRVGTKRDRDDRRGQLQHRLDEAERVNATPAEDESPTAKRRRINRRKQARNRFSRASRELELLSQQVNNVSVSGDPIVAPVDAPVVPPTGTTMAPTTNPSSAAALRMSDAERARLRRANMSSSQRERTRQRNAERQRQRRAQRSAEQVVADRERNRLEQLNRRGLQGQIGLDIASERQAQIRSQLSQEDRDIERQRNTETRAIRRSQQDENERKEEREANAVVQASRRARQTDEERAAERERDRERHAIRRALQTEEEREEERERVRERRRITRHRKALANHEDFRPSMVTGPDVDEDTKRHRLPPTTVCGHCNAWKWPGESESACCIEGKVRLPPLAPAPDELLQLYGDPNFRKQIRAYNQAFAFTSIGASNPTTGRFQNVNQDNSVAGERGVYSYRIQGAMGHYMGSLLPYIDRRTGQRTQPKFAQIYIVDPDMERRAERRMGIFADLDPVALLDIERVMQRYNPFAQQFLTFGERVRQSDMQQPIDLVFRLRNNPSRPRTENLPTVSEVAVTMIEDGNLAQPRDLLVYTKDRNLMRLWETNANYDPLQYPLLLPYGELGWTYTDTYEGDVVRRNKRAMALREHVAYRLFQKDDDRSALHKGGRLFQQYCVDQRAKCEQEELRWIATHQKEIRAYQYNGLRDAYLSEAMEEARTILGDGEGLLAEYDRDTGELAHPDRARNRHFLNQVGKKIILPSSHSGSPRQMYQSYQDSMAIVREYGKPDIFDTMTCNPKWEEIQEQIRDPNQSAQDRPDIVARVWQQKLAAHLKDLDEGVLGRVSARIYVVEFQKRGLPHAHIIVILADEDKPRTRQIIDKIVSAEVPDPDTNPGLYETVMTNMMHGPCGAANPSCVCMKDGKCTKGYPKPFVETTRVSEDGFPQYRRRRRSEGFFTFNGRRYDNATLNQWVVPYNPYFSYKYNCHINIEICTALSVVKYLYKYVYKGSDRAVITVETVQDEGNIDRREPNEIIRYLSARYISPIEACMRLLGHVVQGKSHAVFQLTVHLEGEQMVVFRETEDPERVMDRSERTKLTAFFDICASRAPEDQVAKTIVYQDVPKYFRWDKHKIWVRRKKYQAALGRMIHVSPRDEERFYLRVLLCHRKGPTSFQDIRTVDNVVCGSYKDAALRLGYLENDEEWAACMEEAATFQMAYQLRQLFATLLVYSQVGQVRQLWDNYYGALSEDFHRRFRAMEGQARDDVVMFNTLKSLNELLQVSGKAVHEFDLPQLADFPDLLLRDALQTNNSLIDRETMAYDYHMLQEIVEHEDGLNEGQQAIYAKVMAAVDGSSEGNKLFFLDGPGGTGKSTLLKHILAKVRLSGKIAIAVASSGIAALLLMGGRTAHSTFRIPLKLNAESTCAINKNSALKELIKMASLIIWDEAPMAHRHAFEAVDRSLRDILDLDEPFGGKVVVLSGDFRQILPVVLQGTPADTIDACLKSSELWSKFEQVHLTENMRVRSAANETTAEELAAFSEFLLQVGEGRHQVNAGLGPDFIKIPNDMLIESEPEEEPEEEDEEVRPGTTPRGMRRIIDEMYADINNPEIATDEYFANRTILTTTNMIVQRINEAVSQKLEGDAQEYLSNDSVDNDGDADYFEPELLHSVNMNGIPPHKLTLKKGAPIMMMRNLNPNLGLCNGTRLRVVELKPHVIHATIMTGERHGQHVFIPRIVFLSDGDTREFPFRLRRKQFPVQPAFAMTINKAQGQTVQNLGLYLATPCFSHGQLYVALSRVTARSRLKVMIEYPDQVDADGVYTQNIVYRQIFEM